MYPVTSSHWNGRLRSLSDQNQMCDLSAMVKTSHMDLHCHTITLQDNHFANKFKELSHHLNDQWKLYCLVYNELMKHLPGDTERASESNCVNDQTHET